MMQSARPTKRNLRVSPSAQDFYEIDAPEAPSKPSEANTREGKTQLNKYRYKTNAEPQGNQAKRNQGKQTHIQIQNQRGGRRQPSVADTLGSETQ